MYAGAAILGLIFVYRRFKWLADPYFWGGVAVCLAVVLPWHIYETIQYGDSFWDIYLYAQVVQRVQHVLFSLQPTNYDYLSYIFQFATPWIYAFLASVVAAPFLWRRMQQKNQAVLAASIFGFFFSHSCVLYHKDKGI